MKEVEASIDERLDIIRATKNDFITWHDMVELAAGLGVTRVAKTALSVDGLTMPVGSEKTILIKDGVSAVRQRFTLAHEIGHLFLDDKTTRRIWLRTPLGQGEKAHDALESFCDNVAARILMPKPWLIRDLKDKSPMPSLLSGLAKQYGVSLQAFCIRAIEFLGGPYHIVEWGEDNTGNGVRELQMLWPKPATARGLNGLLPRKTTMHSPIGQLFRRCQSNGIASYSGEIVREAKKEHVEMRACSVQRGTNSTMLAVTRRSRLNNDGPPYAEALLP